MKNPPSFQFYPQDFLSDLNVRSMTDAEVGMYIKLLCTCWIEDGLPSGNSRVVQGYFKKSPTVAQCFVKKDGKYRNPRLDYERDKQRRWREKCSKGGTKSAENKRLVKGSSTKSQVRVNSSSSSSSSSSKEDHKNDLLNIVVSVVSYLNEKTGKRFNPKTKETAALIRARASEGHGFEDFKKVIDVKVAKWKGDPKMDDFLRPSTLFRPTHFEEYLNEVLPKRRREPGESTKPASKEWLASMDRRNAYEQKLYDERNPEVVELRRRLKGKALTDAIGKIEGEIRDKVAAWVNSGMPEDQKHGGPS